MKNLNERAANYAAEKANELLANAIAQAYADGYRDGVKDRDEGIVSPNLEFVDLGLPSGTKWAENFLMEDNGVSYLPYKDAALMNIPTKEQWDELWSSCQWKYDLDDSRELLKAYCVGPNGNVIVFETTGYIEAVSISHSYLVKFWIKDCRDVDEKHSATIFFGGTNNRRRGLENATSDLFSGCRLPVILVRKK